MRSPRGFKRVKFTKCASQILSIILGMQGRSNKVNPKFESLILGKKKLKFNVKV